MVLQGVRRENAPWSEVAHRVLIFSASYLNFSGEYYPGGRQRHIRDAAKVIRNWGREVLVVQKGFRNFETTCPDGIPVIGIKAEVRAKGDMLFARRARRVATKNDVWLYASGEDAWPYFADNSKAIQHGIWWDGPQRLHVRLVQRVRVLSMLRAVRSVLCVDTNFINWVRTLGPSGYALTKKCTYLPNYVDTSKLPVTRRGPHERLSIITARRFEPKRGTLLLLDALALLKGNGVDFTAHICTIGGVDQILQRAKSLGLADRVTVSEESMDAVLEKYQHHHVAVIPTLWSEGTSLACVEAIAAGLPVVVTPVGGLGNLVVPGFNGLIAKPDAASLASAIAQLADAEVWSKMHQNCLSMREAFDYASWAKAFLRWVAE